MMKKSNIAIISLLISLVVLGLGCATNPSISLELERPPNLDTSGISSIAIMPFEYQLVDVSYGLGHAIGDALLSSQTTFYQIHERIFQEIAQYATTVATNNIRQLNNFSIVDRTQADAILVGQITNIGVTDTRLPPPVPPHSRYSRSITIEFNYSLVRPDGSVIGTISRRGGGNIGNAQEADGLPGEETIIQELRRAIDSELRGLYNDLLPHTVSVRRTLARDRTKDDALQAEMTNALELVNSKNYNEALEAYLSIYEKFQSVPAAENASIMYEVMGDTQTAANFMERVFNETGAPRAQEILTQLNRVLEDQAAAAGHSITE